MTERLQGQVMRAFRVMRRTDQLQMPRELLQVLSREWVVRLICSVGHFDATVTVDHKR